MPANGVNANACRRDPYWVRYNCDLLIQLWRLLYVPSRVSYVFVAARDKRTGQWVEESLNLKSAERELREFLIGHPRLDYDLYWCPNPFKAPRRIKPNALSTVFGWCDIDRGKWREFKPIPNIVWMTSHGRTQGIWIWSRFHTVGQAEAMSRALAAHHGGDRNGWSCTKYLRMPYTYNHKPEYQTPRVEMLRENVTPTRRRPKLQGGKAKRSKGAMHLADPIGAVDANDIFEKYKHKIRRDRHSLIKHRRVLSPDRSRCIFMIVQAFHEAGATPLEIANVLWVNPYFISKHGHDEQKLRAELRRILSKLEDQQ